MDIAFLSSIIRELAISLKEGYQLHVRAATVHSILLELSEKAREEAESPKGFLGWDGFDGAVPVLLDIIQDDLFGVARERKDAEDSQVRYVKEAGGTKSEHSLELIASMVTFDPRKKLQGSHSVVDMLVSPFLERLTPDGSSKVIRRVKGCLDNITRGFSRNKTLTPENAFGFAYATIKHYMDNEKAVVLDEGDKDEVGASESLKVSTSEPKRRNADSNERDNTSKGSYSEWRPSVQHVPKTEREAAASRDIESRNLRRIRDGSSAPKLTGSGRGQLALGESNMWNSPSSSAALLFGLQILQIALRKNWKEAESIDPFVSLLSDCICKCGDNEVIRQSMKCLGTMLNEDLESVGENSKKLATKTVELLAFGGSEDVQHACFKLLANLLKSRLNERQTISDESGLLADESKMDVILSYIKQSMLESEQHSQAVSLLKVIVSRKYSSPDMYDLMECVLEQSVRSPKVSLRQQCATIYLSFLLSYPLTPDRLGQEFNQVILNLGYEHSDGRLSAIDLMNQIVKKLPSELLYTKSQIFFLPLTMQLANDKSDECRAAVATCIKTLLSRTNTEICQTLFDYATRWINSTDSRLCRTALQLHVLFVEAVPSFCKQETISNEILSIVDNVLVRENAMDWEVKYFALSLLETMVGKLYVDPLDGKHESLSTITLQSLTSDHPWIQLASSRLIWKHLHLLNPSTLDACQSFLRQKGMLFNLGKNVCGSLAQLDESSSYNTGDLVDIIGKILTWLLVAMDTFPSLCFLNDSETGTTPTRWVFKRLSGIAKFKNPTRRQAVFQLYLLFASTELENVLKKNLDCMLESLHRVELESSNDNTSIQWKQDRGSTNLSKEAELAQEVLQFLESKYEEEFVANYAMIRKKAKDNKAERKQREKAEAARDPKLAAERRIHKNLMDKKRRKRRVDERRSERGATAKRRHFDIGI
jgi:U3 small nucleolar RNA-associated protein 20